LQPLDAQRAETVAWAGIVVCAQVGPVGFGVDARLAVEQSGIGVFDGEQAGEDLLLGGVPALLAKRLANRQGPVVDQCFPCAGLDRAIDQQIETVDRGSQAGVEC